MTTTLTDPKTRPTIHEQNVDRGIALLDERGPAYWDDLIDLPALCMDYNCVMYQVYGSYNVGLLALGIDDDPEHYGFTVTCCGDGIQARWDALAATWREKIALRRLGRG